MKLSAKHLSAFLVSLTFTFLSLRSKAQVEMLPKVYRISSDVTILEGRTSGNNELTVKNATRNIFGPLANQGEGALRFHSIVDTILPVNDTTIRIYTSFEHDIFYDFTIRGAAAAIGLQNVLNVSSNLLTDNQISLADGTSYKIYAGGPDDGIRTITGHTHYGWWAETADTVNNISGSIATYLGNAEMFAGNGHVFFTANVNVDSGFVYKEQDNGEGHTVPFRGIRYANPNPSDWTEATLVTKKYVDSILSVGGSTDLSGSTTDDLAEGATNKYFSNGLARSAISASGSLSYNSTTGVISYTQPTNVSTYTNDANYISGTGTSGYTPYFSGTGSLSGSVNHFWDNTNNRLGILTSAPTHSLTLGSTSTGIAIYNTSDQTTNYERLAVAYNSNNIDIGSYIGGTGTSRSIRIGVQTSAGSTTLSSGRVFTINQNPSSTVGAFDFTVGTGVTGNILSLGGTQAQSTGSSIMVDIHPTYNQSSTAGYTALRISPQETATGSGNKYLLDAGINSGSGGGGTHTSKFVVDRGGNAFFAGILGIGTGTTISANVHSLSTTEQLRLGYDVSNYASFTVSSTGQLTISHQTSTKFNAKLIFDATNTASGTTGAQTINKPSGSVNFAAGAQTLVLTNNLITTSSHVLCQVETDDTTADGVKCVIVSSGSATIKLTAPTTAETKVAFWVRD